VGSLGSIDGSRGFARGIWDKLADGGVWGIPRCGLVYRKDAEAKELVLIMRMPWFEGLSASEQQLLDSQEHDHAGIIDMFDAIGVGVREEEA